MSTSLMISSICLTAPCPFKLPTYLFGGVLSQGPHGRAQFLGVYRAVAIFIEEDEGLLELLDLLLRQVADDLG